MADAVNENIPKVQNLRDVPLYLIRVLIRKQCGLSAGVPEKHGLVFLEKSLADEINHSAAARPV